MRNETVVVIVASEAYPRTRRLLAILSEGGLETEVARGAAAGLLAASARRARAILFDPENVDADSFRRAAGRRPCALVAWMGGASSLHAARLLGGGADEVLHDGMTAEEILARVRKAAGTTSHAQGVLELGLLRIDLAHGEVLWAEKEVHLSGREREVLYVLAESAGRPVRREVLYSRVWGYTMARGDRTVDVNVKRLRAKLAGAGVGVAIGTRPTVGYRLDVTTTASARRSPRPVPAAVGRPEA